MKNLKILSLVLAVACTSSVFSNESQYRPLAYVKAFLEKCGLKRQSIDRTVHGDLFMIPSYSGSYRESDLSMFFDQEKWKMYKKNGKSIKDCDLKGTFVSVWATSQNCPDVLITNLTEAERNDPDNSCNWADHGHKRLDKFPKVLPLKLFIGENGDLKGDGDTVTLFHKNKKTRENLKVVLTLNQRGHRYRSYGPGFDDCIKRSGGYETEVKPYLNKPYTNPLSVFHSFVG